MIEPLSNSEWTEFWAAIGYAHGYTEQFDPPRKQSRDCLSAYLDGWGAGTIAGVHDRLTTQEKPK